MPKRRVIAVNVRSAVVVEGDGVLDMLTIVLAGDAECELKRGGG